MPMAGYGECSLGREVYPGSAGAILRSQTQSLENGVVAATKPVPISTGFLWYNVLGSLSYQHSDSAPNPRRPGRPCDPPP
eukprot:3236329-Rhodomonas_salina.7